MMRPADRLIVKQDDAVVGTRVLGGVGAVLGPDLADQQLVAYPCVPSAGEKLLEHGLVGELI